MREISMVEVGCRRDEFDKESSLYLWSLRPVSMEKSSETIPAFFIQATKTPNSSHVSCVGGQLTRPRSAWDLRNHGC